MGIVGAPMVVVLNIDNPQRYAPNKMFRRHVTLIWGLSESSLSYS